MMGFASLYPSYSPSVAGPTLFALQRNESPTGASSPAKDAGKYRDRKNLSCAPGGDAVAVRQVDQRSAHGGGAAGESRGAEGTVGGAAGPEPRGARRPGRRLLTAS